MTSTNAATSALPTPRTPQQVIYLPGTTDLHRRPAGAHAVPDEQLVDDDAWWDAETEAQFQGSAHRRPLAQHGRRCSCCRPALAGAVEVA